MKSLIVETYETRRNYPIVVHIFNGETQDEALRYFHSHLQADNFLRGCTESGKYGQIPCRVTMRWK